MTAPVPSPRTGDPEPTGASIAWFEILLVLEAVLLATLGERVSAWVAGPWLALGGAGLMLGLVLLRHDPDWPAVRARATPVQGDLLRFALLLGAPLLGALSGASLIAWTRAELGWSGGLLALPILVTMLLAVLGPAVHLLAHRPQWRRPWPRRRGLLRATGWMLMLFAAWQWQVLLQRQLADAGDDPVIAFVVALFFVACFYLPCRAALHDGRRLALSLPILVMTAFALSGIGLFADPGGGTASP